jgi:hypothetical protein
MTAEPPASRPSIESTTGLSVFPETISPKMPALLQSLNRELAEPTKRVEREGMRLNTLAVKLLGEGFGERRV